MLAGIGHLAEIHHRIEFLNTASTVTGQGPGCPSTTSESESKLREPYLPSKKYKLDEYLNYKKRIPSAIIIGVRKAGTRALLDMLKMHPQIAAAKYEIHFFDDDINYEKGNSWYLKKLTASFPDQMTIEKTPRYFVEENVPARMKELNKDMKMILIVRNPVDRIISSYAQRKLSRLISLSRKGLHICAILLVSANQCDLKK